MNVRRSFPLHLLIYPRLRHYPPLKLSPLALLPDFIPSINPIQTLAPLPDQIPPVSNAEIFDLFGAVSRNPNRASLDLLNLLPRLCETKSLGRGFQCHAQITKSGLFGDFLITNLLVNLYSKCGAFRCARKVLDEMPEPNSAAWSAVISGYTKSGRPREALEAFHEMRSHGLMWNEFTFPSVLKASTIRGDLRSGKQIHGVVVVTGFDSDVIVANALVVMYAKCSEFSDSRRLFDEMPERNDVTWNALFSCYLQGSFFRDVLDLFNEMICTGVKPNDFTLSSALNALSGLGDAGLGRRIHGYLVKLGFESDQYSANALVDMYMKVGDHKGSINVFRSVSCPDIFSSNAMIAVCIRHGDHDLALQLFDDMKKSEVYPNFFTLSSVLKACAATKLQGLGKQLHSLSLKMDMREDPYLGIGLIDMYFKCYFVDDAIKVFKGMQVKDMAVWGCMISGLSYHGKDEEALMTFADMYKEGVGYDQRTLSLALKSSASLQDGKVCRQIHSIAVKSGLQFDDYVARSLVDAYRKSGSIEDASRIFKESESADLVTSTSMITAYSQSGQGEEALKLFVEMGRTGLLADHFVCSSLLSACTSLSAYEQGRQVHVNVMKLGYTLDEHVGNSLVSMYAKCGSIDEASRSFSMIKEKTVVSWSAMIGGLAQHGHGKEAIELFGQMLEEGINPNQVTLVSVLYACNHAGLVDQAKHYLNSMEELFGIKPTQEHYYCMIDLLGRAGKLDEAIQMLDTMPYEPHAKVWGALLAASRIHKNVPLGERAAQKLLVLEPEKSGTHILMANLYASTGMWEKVSEMRRLMKESNVRKEPGRSWMEMRDKVYTFVSGDRSNARSKEIYAKLEEVGEKMRKAGFVAMVETDLHNVGEEEREILLSYHSEKLAVAFGLIASPPGATIRVKKNTRICVDCHAAMKFICEIEKREIIVRDNNRYHHFRDGSCSCGDYW